jgi:ATP phosphoribosyltransferase
LKDCGISINNGIDQLKAEATNFPLEVLYLRNSDIPQYLIDGVVDIAIVGDNLLVEKGKEIQVIQNLGFQNVKFRLLFQNIRIQFNQRLRWAAYRDLLS